MKLIDAIKEANKVSVSNKQCVIVYDGDDDAGFILIERTLQGVLKERITSKVNEKGQYTDIIGDGFFHIPLTITPTMAKSYAWGIEYL